jgi:hypothetical protein
VSGPWLLVLGRELRALESVPTVGELLGLSRGQAFRAASDWPCTGPTGGRRVVVPALCDQMGIPYEIEEVEGE